MDVKQTILVIDDGIQMRRLLEINLSANGYRAVEAETGKDGYLLAASVNPVLIILDLGLPDMDGLDVLKKLREWYTGLIIILSVRNSEEDIVRALDNGANDYLTKPFRTRELLARIRVATHQVIRQQEASMVFDNLTIDLAKQVATKNNEIIKGVEFLRRFAMHILPRGFVKIRYFGILTSRYKPQVKSLKTKPDIVQLTETLQQRLLRLTGYNACQCPRCKTGNMQMLEILPRIRSPDNVFYPRTANLNM